MTENVPAPDGAPAKVQGNAPMAEPTSTRLHWPCLLVGLSIMLVGSAYPLLFTNAAGRADHGLVLLLLWAMSAGLGACRTLGVESENAPQRGQFWPDSQPHSGAMGQEAGEKWAAAAHSQPTIPKSDRLLVRGVGFVPRAWPWRALFSGAACALALGLAAALRLML